MNRTFYKRALLGLSLLLLSACRLVITTDDTGHIISASGSYDCDQPLCETLIDEFVTESFTAVPADGYRFVGWTGICAKIETQVCDLTLFPLTGKFKQFEGEIPLSAVFESDKTERAWYRDRDGDGYGTPTMSKLSFKPMNGFVTNQSDCDDRNSDVHPLAKEQADSVDNNCDGLVDEGFVPSLFYIDRDGDKFGDPSESRLELKQPAGYVANNLDCHDLRASDNPDAVEVVDGRDNDCDGIVDEVLDKQYPDTDGDGYGATTGFIKSPTPIDGYVENNRDCDDNNNSIFPGATELFDSADNNCDGAIDEGFVYTKYFRDADGDGFGDKFDSQFAYTIPDGYVTKSNDNCISISNPTQVDGDNDGIGDACDPFTDSDGDGLQDSADNCPATHNPNQSDTDGDGLGDSCDNQNGLDVDNDGVNNNSDNCPNHYNPSQLDSDGDGLGDTCDEVNNNGGGGGGCSTTAEEQAMLDAVNATRAQGRSCGSEGWRPAVAALDWNCKLQAAAVGHSMDMANTNFFSHTGSNGQSVGYRATQAGFVWSTVGENIAAGIPLSSVSAVVQGWIDSPGHCANLMHGGFTKLGAAKYSNPSSTYNVYWTQVFGKPR